MLQYLFPMLKRRIFLMILLQKSSTLPFDSCSADRKTVYTPLKYQVDIGSAQIINCQICLIGTLQAAARIGVPNKANYVTVFHNL